MPELLKDKPVILARNSKAVKDELEIAKKYFEVVESRIGLTERLVIGRYSVLPHYREMNRDLVMQRSMLVNSTLAHQYIANFDYYEDVKAHTPRTWFSLSDVKASGHPGPFIVKGRTNSRKFDWKTKMYAENFEAAVRVASELQSDGLICEQGVVIREFVNLEILEVGINDLPFANEWRIFYLSEDRLAHGFYWTISEKTGEIDDAGLEFADSIAKIISDRATFFVLDIARKLDGTWTLIEVNDGQMSGLCGVDAEDLYSSMAAVYTTPLPSPP